MSDVRYAEVVDPTTGALARRSFRELRAGDIFRLFEPDGECVDHGHLWRALTDGNDGALSAERVHAAAFTETP